MVYDIFKQGQLSGHYFTRETFESVKELMDEQGVIAVVCTLLDIGGCSGGREELTLVC